MRRIEVLQGGFLTTVQDGGRPGWRQYGMPAAGPLDEYAHRAANLLVGNHSGEAALEITVQGPALRFSAGTLAAVTGAPVEPRVGEDAAPMWQSFVIPARVVLTFGLPRSGCRAYLALAGGLDLPLVLGSRAAYLPGSTGGMDGRGLKEGDLLFLKTPEPGEKLSPGRRLAAADIPSYPAEQVIRVIPGPQEDYFTARGCRVFYGEAYTVTARADRMGCRLNGPAVAHAGKAEIISEGMLPGSVQVPPHGQPIVIMADGPTSGGYPKIATVITPDLARLARLKTGDRVTFQKISLRRAYRLLEQYRENPALLHAPGSVQRHIVQVDGRVFSVTVEKE